jgi:hypothetical protein
MGIPYGEGSTNPNYRPSDLDANQVLQHAFDEENCRLRVDASIGLSGDGFAVDVDHTEDSIRLGDGTNFITSTINGFDVGLDVNLINPVTLDRDGIGATPNISNIAMAVAAAEYSYGIVSGTKKLTIKSRQNGKLQIAWTSGQTGTNYLTISPGSSYTIDSIDTSTGLTLYFQSTKDTDTLEILYWT